MKVQVVSPVFTPKFEATGVEGEQTNALPPQKGVFYRAMRHPRFRPYIRLILMTVGVNVAIFLNSYTELTLAKILNITLVNFVVGAILRQHEVVNLLFKMATSIPKNWPLSIRWAAGKVYHFGGIHIGGFFAGTLWFAYFLLKGYETQNVSTLVLALGVFHLLILITIMIVALPQIRMPHHNLFERVARFGSWISLSLFWGQGYLMQDINYLGLGIITYCFVKPWLHLKKVDVSQVRPSQHVTVSKFNYGVTPFAGSSTELSTNPLLEWHSFANIPSPHEKGFRLCISRAGDWTGDYINNLPKKIWVRGVPAAGVGNIEKCFKRVIWVATGSGVGPCIPHLIDQKVPSRLVWATRSPRETYGDELVDEILAAQPEALIWDTTAHGKPDLVKLAYQAYNDFDAEAVIVISNQKVTFHVNYELESRGIPAFGAIWDS